MNHDLVSYYDKRAMEYEKVYLNPAEQGDLLRTEKIFQDPFAHKRRFGDRLRDGLLDGADRQDRDFSLRDGYQRKRDRDRQGKTVVEYHFRRCR